MTEQQHQQPNTLDPVTQKLWDNWVDARIVEHVRISRETIREELDGLADEIGVTSG